ncbi:MAG: IclR family transcriptional regulator [Spirochaetia bacterium]|nr:IclR family transcriptional regulator [Spirochaetia bacterium]
MTEQVNKQDDFEKDREKNKYLIPNIARALRIMEHLARKVREAGIAELATELNYPNNSVFRIIRSLEFYGYVEEHNRKYRLTPRLLYLGYAGMRNNGITDNAIDIMQELRDDVNETVMIGKLLGNQVVIIEQLLSYQYIKFSTEIGAYVNIHASAPGKAILAFLPDNEKNKVLDQIVFTRYTNVTIPSKREMLEELSRVASKGFAIDNGEQIPEIHCVGAPIFDYRHYPVAAIWVSGPAFRFCPEVQERVGQKMKEYALRISYRFGFDPGLL